MDTQSNDFKFEANITEEDLAVLLQSEEERKVAAKILFPLTAQIQLQAEGKYAARLNTEVTKLVAANKEAMEKELERIREQNRPLTPEEMQALLSQEYLEFKVKLRDGAGEREFVLRELPMEVETKLLQTIRRTLKDKVQQLATLEFNPGASILENLERTVAVVPGILETLADFAAICLDPYAEQGITGEWIRKTIGMNRLLAIIQAQMAVGRYRDFWSRISRLTPSMVM